MSLFKTRTFWSIHCDTCEEGNFDQNSLIAARLNDHHDFIVSGSHSGTLRIFRPELSDTGELYKPSHLVVEKQLSAPVLQIGCGRLVSGSSKMQLAVLHPRLLSIYSLQVKDGAAEHGVQNILHLNYEHKLRRSAANLALGPFGGNQNRDFICVQSLDGMLSFYEQESFAFCCFLPDFLLPGPMAFVKKSDSFVLGGSDWSLCSFKYKLLSELGQNSSESDDAGKKITPDWKFNLGEGILDIQAVDDANLLENSIMVLGERNFFCINDSGKLKYMKKLDFAPICFANYILDDTTVSLVISETKNLLIYQNTSLKWSAQLEFSAIAIKRSNLEQLNGVIVLLSEDGQLECCYLGTEPSLFVAPPIAQQDIDFDRAGLELATLHKVIKASYKNDIQMTNASAERELVLSVSVNPELELCTFRADNKMCTITVDLLPQGSTFEEVQIAIIVQKPLQAEPQSQFFSNLSERTEFKCHIFGNANVGKVASLCAEITATFVSNLGVPRCLTKTAWLPLNLVAETCPPHKDSTCRITLNINQSPVPLSQLFPEFAGENGLAAGSAIGFRSTLSENKDDVVSILLAKSSERYRLQANSLASLSLWIEQIVYRLKKFSERIVVSFNSALPVDECIQCIRQHFSARKNYAQVQGELSQLSAQFRLIQKRLIAKFKVKNPTPLTNLELLLQDTFAELIKSGEKLHGEFLNLSMAQNELGCSLHAIANLIKLMDCCKSDDGNNNLSSIVLPLFSFNVYDLDDGQSWEDVMDASLCYLLRTALAKSDKDRLRAAHTSFDEVKDVSKIEKHFVQVLERLPKGVLLENDCQQSSNEANSEDKTLETLSADEKDDEVVPIGSKIGVDSSRLLSARKATMRLSQIKQ